MPFIEWFWNELSFLGALAAGTLIIGGRANKRRHFVPRILVSVAVIVFVTALYEYLRINVWSSGIFSLNIYLRLNKFFLQYLLITAAYYACYESNIWTAFFCSTVGYCMQNLSYRIYDFLVGFVITAELHYILHVLLLTAITAGVYVAVYFIVVHGHRYDFTEITVVNYVQLIVSACAIIILVVAGTTLLASVRRNGSATDYVFANIVVILCVLFILMFQCGTFFIRKREGDIEKLNRMIEAKKEQYELQRANIEQLNIKFHDLRHRLTEGKYGIVGEEAEKIADSLEIYDRFIRTGNEAIDTVLIHKNLECHKLGIQFTCSLCGDDFSFIPPSELYALFGNIMDNAISAAEKLPEDERHISLVEFRKGGFIVLREVNGYTGEIRFENGLPVTEKDRNYHGFGVRSIQLLTEKYGGYMSIRTYGGLFMLDLFFTDTMRKGGMPITES